MPITSPLQFVNASFKDAYEYTFNNSKKWFLAKFTFGTTGVIELEFVNRDLHPNFRGGVLKKLDPSAQVGDQNVSELLRFVDYTIVSSIASFSPYDAGEMVEARLVIQPVFKSEPVAA
jgi:hypothetical protein